MLYIIAVSFIAGFFGLLGVIAGLTFLGVVLGVSAVMPTKPKGK